MATSDVMANSAPTFTPGAIARQRVEANTTLPRNVGNRNVDVSGAFNDPDGDTLTYTAKSSSAVVQVIGVTGDTVVLRGLGTVGTARITVTADDGRGGTVEGSFEVAVELAAPSVTLTPGPGQLTVTWPDVDGAHVFYTLQWKSASQGWAAGTTASNAQSGHVIENLSARFAYDVRVRAVAPQNSQAGPWSEVEQGTPLNRPPVAVRELGDVVVDRGSNRRVSASGAFSDPDGGALSYTAASDNPGIATVSVSDDTVTVTGVAEGSVSIRVTADDGQSGRLTQDFQLLVTPTPTAPSNVRAMGGGSRRLDVIWDAATAAPHGYRVRWRAEGFVFLPFNSAVVESGTSYTISGLTDGTTYVAQVYTLDAEGNDGPSSDTASGVAGAFPTAPKDLRVTGLREAGALRVEWAPADSQPNGYQVRWRERDSGGFPAGNIARVGTTSTLGGYRYKITGLDTDGTVYIVRVDTLVTDGTTRPSATAMASGTPLPLIRIAGDSVLSVTEGGADPVVRVALSYALREAVEVEYITLQGTAKAKADYTAVRDILTIAAGATSGALTVAVVDDNQDEPVETFDVHLRKVPLNVVSPTAIWRTPVTIADNDAAPDGIALRLPAHTSVAENAGVLGEFELRVTATVEGATRFGAVRTVRVTVSVPASGSHLASPSDFTTQTADLVLHPGDDSVSGILRFTPTNDNELEGDEALEVSGTVVGDTGVSVRSAELTLTDDEKPGLSIADAGVAESDSEVTFTVTMSDASREEVTLSYTTQDDTATAGADYTTASGTLTLAVGETSGTLTVPVLADSLDEDDESFLVVLSDPSGASFANAVAIGTITDDDALPTLAFENPTAVLSGPEGGTISSAVLLSPASGREVRVSLDAVIPSGTAIRGLDYAAAATLVFAAGETRQTFSISLYEDARNEVDETFTIRLHSARNAEVSSSAGTVAGTIVDNDALPSLSIEDARMKESRFGPRTMIFRVRMSETSGRAVTVDYFTSSGTASSGNDYRQQNNTLVFIAGSRSNLNEIHIAILDDELHEGDETFTVSLSNPSGATLGTAIATGTIEDNEEAPVMSIADARVSEAKFPRTVDFAVSLSVASSSVVTVNYATSDGSATAGADFGDDYEASSGTLTIVAGATGGTIRVPLSNDGIYEGDESFTVVLSNLSGVDVSFSRGRATGTIVDNELPLHPGHCR